MDNEKQDSATRTVRVNSDGRDHTFISATGWHVTEERGDLVVLGTADRALGQFRDWYSVTVVSQ